ncbi:hypothetical protein [Raineyella sp.]|uniref:hypothetical protein n=1 Tax=Raineyella sp. TaxID=1911550 RepID=UPI002B1F02B7|nr:hypothetical protein [Raineyella sp.]MEA5155275.1 hypothetical protein [Raineyella sp.]
MTHTDVVNAAASALRALSETEGGDRLARQLSRLVMAIADEAARTKRFRGDLLAALTLEPPADPAASGPLTRTRLQRLTKADLSRLINRDRMDPDRTLKSRSTKGEMIELILAFQASQVEIAVSTDDSVQDAPMEPTAAATPAATSVQASPPLAPERVAEQASESAPDESTAPLPPTNPPKRRRQPSPLDPYAVAAADGADGLRDQLMRLDIEQLKDVIAEYGMNYDGRAMSWHDQHRLVNRILEKTDFGATQGAVFRSGTTFRSGTAFGAERS